MALYRPDMTSDQEQELLGRYRSARGEAGLQTDLTDKNVLDDPEFQQWGGGGFDAAQPTAPAMAGLAAAGPDIPTPQTTFDTGGIGGGGGATGGLKSVGGNEAAQPTVPGAPSVGGGVADSGSAGMAGFAPPPLGPSFRPNLGMRTYGNENSALAGLRRIY